MVISLAAVPLELTLRRVQPGGAAPRARWSPLCSPHPTLPRTVVLLLTSSLVSGCSAAGAPSFPLFGAFFPAWLLCGGVGLIGAGAARGAFVATGLSDRLPYQLFVCTAIGVLAACLAWLFTFRW